MPGPDNFCFLTVQPRIEAAERQMLPAKKGGLEKPRQSPPGRTLGLDLPFCRITLSSFFISRPSETAFPNSVCVWFQWGVKIVLERPVIMKEQEEGGNSLEPVISGSSWSMPIRHDFIYFEVVASNLVRGGENWY